MEKTFESRSPAETAAIAQEFLKHVKAGDVVCLEGDLGAGKTAFTQAFACAAGVERPVTSPTFCIVSEYEARDWRLAHMDLYRLSGPDDVLACGWEEFLSRGYVVFVEWPGCARDLIPPGAWRVEIEHGTGPESRRIKISRPGEGVF